MEYLALIPARGGSKGVPKKNIKPLLGKPLIHYTLETALETFPLERIQVSTDDPEIQAAAEASGVPVPELRPAHLATDTATTYEVLLHALDRCEREGVAIDAVVLLQPTSPFRQASQIREAMALFERRRAEGGVDMVVSAVETRANPYYVLFEEGPDGFLVPSKKSEVSRRQDAPKVWEYNGAIYVMDKEALRASPPSGFTRRVPMVMDEVTSFDIDTPLDWKIAEVIAGERLAQKAVR